MDVLISCWQLYCVWSCFLASREVSIEYTVLRMPKWLRRGRCAAQKGMSDRRAGSVVMTGSVALSPEKRTDATTADAMSRGTLQGQAR